MVMHRERGFVARKSLCLALAIFLFAGPALFARVWTDRQGRQTEAQFVRLRGDSVVLQKGLKPLVIPLKEFCDEDQEYIKELTKGKGGAKPAAAAKGEEATKDAGASTPATKPKSGKTADGGDPFLTDEEKVAQAKPAAEANPFLTDQEKSAAGANKEETKTSPLPKAEKNETPKINAEGGFEQRTWTDRKGNKLTANFSRLEGKVVVLLKDGAEQRYPIDEFSYNDKLYIRQAALELQKYEKFAGNRQKPQQSEGSPAQAAPGPTPVVPVQSANPMLQAMQQQAEAQRQRLEERQRQMAAEAEQRRQQAEEAQRQQEAQKQAAEAEWKANLERQRAEQQRLVEEANRRMQQQVDSFPRPISPPLPNSPASSQSFSASQNYPGSTPPPYVIVICIIGVLVVIVVGILIILALVVRGGSSNAGSDELSALDIAIIIFCPGWGLIAGLIRLIMGSAKAGKTLGLSVVFIVFWSTVRFILIAMMK
jgi:hypothetical protein